MDSNYTLRFPRTYREATRQDAHFHDHQDRRVGWVVACCCFFALGLAIGGLA